MACVEQSTIVNLKLLHESFPKVNSCRDAQLLSNVIALRRKLMTFDNSHADFQVLTIYEDESTKLCNAIFSDLEEMIVEKIKSTNAEMMSDIHCKKINHIRLRHKHEILSCDCSIYFFDETKVAKTKYENHADIPPSLQQLAEAESNNDENELSICYKLLSK